MAEYQFAKSNGEIVIENYVRSSNLADDVLSTIKEVFDQFPHEINIEKVIDLEDVYHVRFINNEYEDTFLCVKGTTPGGRSALKDEQRIQPKSKYLNYVYDKSVNGFKGIYMGIYKHDGVTVLCTWKVTQSDAASPETPISKQIKITSIANAIKEGFVQQSRGRGEFACAFTPAFLYFYIKNSSWLHGDQINELNNYTEINGNTEETVLIYSNDSIESQFSKNRILFGAPGTGKSHTLEEEMEYLLVDDKEDYERVTFHPDYTYSQFVGTYKPVSMTNDEGMEEISYQYVPGPFIRTYVKALKSLRSDNPKPYLLLIEEINRAKVAAVFGDVFQLLDRKEGVSEYPVRTSEDLKKYLKNELDISENQVSILKLPSNFYIWATMNSADQGVFPMDTAFKRRWDFEYLELDGGESKIKGYQFKVSDKTYNWNALRKALNKVLSEDYKVNEDKLMGPFFIKLNSYIKRSNDENAEVNSNENNDENLLDEKFLDVFKNKVLMYLFEDAAKQKRRDFFTGVSNTNRYSVICKEFEEKGLEIFDKNVSQEYENFIQSDKD